ncbi:MAG: 4-hydroxythreonine-4-phosphate dehydrogenase PdxA [Deltaproteobacteria bacterium]|nr:4-hydroxythreonine-4-phosphate dehydrogenase PdxA [Deltaproteobacteria bacterium]
MTRPLGITLGDPAGIGPEVIVRALAHPRLGRVPAVVLGDVELLRATARRLRARVAVTPLAEAARLAGSGALAGIVTAPISKESVTRAGFPISGHTSSCRSSRARAPSA